MKRILWLVLLVMALPLAAFADSNVDFSNIGGTLTSNTGTTSTVGVTTLSLSGSVLTSINGLGGGLITGNLGKVSFTTGTLLTGSLQNGGTFNSGGSFTITYNGTTIFSGSFLCGTGQNACTWVDKQRAGGQNTYILSGPLTGTWANGTTVSATTTQLTIEAANKFSGSLAFAGGTTNVVVPEPGSLTLMGTGLVGLAGLIRRKLKV